MVAKMYEVIFKVTETCNNGNERRITKTVLSPCFKDGHFVTEAERINKAIEVLKGMHYYDITYVGMKHSTVLFTEEIAF